MGQFRNSTTAIYSCDARPQSRTALTGHAEGTSLKGKGKSGGYRVITYYGGIDAPVFLLTVFSKGQRADLTQRERNGLARLTKSLVPSLGPRFKT